MGWSAVCDCGTSLSYSLILSVHKYYMQQTSGDFPRLGKTRSLIRVSTACLHNLIGVSAACLQIALLKLTKI